MDIHLLNTDFRNGSSRSHPPCTFVTTRRNPAALS